MLLAAITAVEKEVMIAGNSNAFQYLHTITRPFQTVVVKPKEKINFEKP